MNLWAPQFDGGTLFHVSGTGVDEQGVVTAMVDTRARDAMKVWAIIARNRQARRNPARLWLQEHRSSRMLHDSITEWDEVGGEVERIALEGGAWNVFPVVAGQEGTVRSLRIDSPTRSSSRSGCSASGSTRTRLQRLVGNPLTEAGYGALGRRGSIRGQAGPGERAAVRGR